MGISRTRGFTLIELLVVLATIMLLAAVTMPVFRAARESAKRTTCFSNFRQVAVATQIYLGDYEDRYMPINHRPGQNGPPGQDLSWVQLTMPYVKSFSVFKCPSDYGRKRGSEGVFDGDLVVNDTDIAFFATSQRSNVGYNHQYLAPVVRSQGQWMSVPRFATQVSDPGRTLQFVDTAWEVDAKGQPRGGGRWIVAPPCRYEVRNGARLDTFASEGSAWSPDTGWGIAGKGPHPYGGAFPWHSEKLTVIRLDTSAKGLTVKALLAGCTGEPNWQGQISNPDEYIWDIR